MLNKDSHGIIAPIVNNTNNTKLVPKSTFVLLELVAGILPSLSLFSVNTVINSAIERIVGIKVQQNTILNIPAFILPA